MITAPGVSRALCANIGNHRDIARGKVGCQMISYAPLWKTMRERGATTYTLEVKGNISSSTVRRLKAGESVSTNTLDSLCKILDCSITDVIEFVDDRTK